MFWPMMARDISNFAYGNCHLENQTQWLRFVWFAKSRQIYLFIFHCIAGCHYQPCQRSLSSFISAERQVQSQQPCTVQVYTNRNQVSLLLQCWQVNMQHEHLLLVLLKTNNANLCYSFLIKNSERTTQLKPIHVAVVFFIAKSQYVRMHAQNWLYN